MFDKYQDKARESPFHPRILQTIRLLQFLAALVSIILYIVFIVRQATPSTSNEAVLGILAGGIIFTLIAIGKACYAKRKVAGLVLLFLIVDLVFVAAYITVAILARGAVTGSSCRVGNEEDGGDDGYYDDDGWTRGSTDCSLKKGVFALSMINIKGFSILCQALLNTSISCLIALSILPAVGTWCGLKADLSEFPATRILFVSWMCSQCKKG